MGLVDHLLVLLLVLVQPAQSYWEGRRNAERFAKGEDLDRIRVYRQIGIIEWLFLAVLITAWSLQGRSFLNLGFTLPTTTGWMVAGLLVCAIIAYTVFSHRWLRSADHQKLQAQIDELGSVGNYLPRTERELTHFYGISITAGVVEEIAYRGFLLWYLSQYVSIPIAIVLSSIPFGLAHSYQGATGALKTGLIGLLFAVVYVISGSIWVPIVIHALLDMAQGRVLLNLWQRVRAHGQGTATPETG